MEHCVGVCFAPNRFCPHCVGAAWHVAAMNDRQGAKDAKGQEPGEVFDDLARRVIGAAIEVHRPVRYKGFAVGVGRPDFVVGVGLVVEIKAVSSLAVVHQAQIVSYLKALGSPLRSAAEFQRGNDASGDETGRVESRAMSRWRSWEPQSGPVSWTRPGSRLAAWRDADSARAVGRRPRRHSVARTAGRFALAPKGNHGPKTSRVGQTSWRPWPLGGSELISRTRLVKVWSPSKPLPP